MLSVLVVTASGGVHQRKILETKHRAAAQRRYKTYCQKLLETLGLQSSSKAKPKVNLNKSKYVSMMIMTSTTRCQTKNPNLWIKCLLVHVRNVQTRINCKTFHSTYSPNELQQPHDETSIFNRSKTQANANASKPAIGSSYPKGDFSRAILDPPQHSGHVSAARVSLRQVTGQAVTCRRFLLRPALSTRCRMGRGGGGLSQSRCTAKDSGGVSTPLPGERATATATQADQFRQY